MIYTRLSSLPQRGFALLIAVVLTSVVLALGAALLDIAYKQVLLSSSAKNSQIAFYNADSALECALYYDQHEGAFYYGSTYLLSDVKCNNVPVAGPPSRTPAGQSPQTTIFSVPCAGAGGGVSAEVTIIKKSSGETGIYANGYSSCTDIPSRIERGLKAKY